MLHDKGQSKLELHVVTKQSKLELQMHTCSRGGHGAECVCPQAKEQCQSLRSLQWELEIKKNKYELHLSST